MRKKLKIPTLLGLSIIMIGIVAGVLLTLKEQIFLSKASPDVTAQNITLSNISDTEVSISWQTSSPAVSFITYGQVNPTEQTALNDKDADFTPARPKPHFIHYVTLRNLLPKTNYQYKVITGKIESAIGKFSTALPIKEQSRSRPIIGSVLDGDKPLEEGVIYLSINDATTQSAQVKMGNFLIPLFQIRKSDLSDSYPITDDTLGKLTVISEKGSTNALFKLQISNNPLPSIKIGQDVDFTTEQSIITPSPSPSIQELIIYDLNGDNKINSADNAIVLQNFGEKSSVNSSSNPKNKKADLNKDGVVDQKDLDLMAKQINQ